MQTLLEPRVLQANPDEDDVERLIEQMGQSAYFQDRILLQKQGKGALLIAWMGERAVGDVYVWWERADEEEIRHNLPDVPLLTHLEVHAELRSRGIGAELIASAEELLIEGNHRQVALAVEESNVRAVALYERCGYREWDHGPVKCLPYTDESGGPQAVEVCRVFVKDLTARSRAFPGRQGA